ncbi:MAG: hypothetical protein Q9167_004893 [Letrouitia subvulpina]
MRLLNTETIHLHSFSPTEIPPYAILSHTWGRTEEEVSFQELSDPKNHARAGRLKIERCCRLAASEGWQYVWIDTCCIDKTSSTELSEAINSMFAWYENAQVCYAYLSDVFQGSQNSSTWPVVSRGFPRNELHRSYWFQRGWTLQELLAPRTVIFYDQEWQMLGTKWELSDQITQATGISHQHLKRPNNASVAMKMSWASRRKTARVEDVAYCLLGLLNVNMPLIYGEGTKAFLRLQQEIIKISDDETIFAWTDPGLHSGGLFARSPSAFAKSGNIIKAPFRHLERPPIAMTNKGLTMEVICDHHQILFSDSDRCRMLVELQCARIEYPKTAVQIEMIRTSRDEWVRSGEWMFPCASHPYEDPKMQRRVIYIPQTYSTIADASNQQPPPKQLSVFHIQRQYRAESGFLGINCCPLPFKRTRSLALLQSYTVPESKIRVLDEEIKVKCRASWVLAALLLRGHTGHNFILLISAHENDAEMHLCAAKNAKRDFEDIANEWNMPRCCFKGGIYDIVRYEPLPRTRYPWLVGWIEREREDSCRRYGVFVETRAAGFRPNVPDPPHSVKECDALDRYFILD